MIGIPLYNDARVGSTLPVKIRLLKSPQMQKLLPDSNQSMAALTSAKRLSVHMPRITLMAPMLGNLSTRLSSGSLIVIVLRTDSGFRIISVTTSSRHSVQGPLEMS